MKIIFFELVIYLSFLFKYTILYPTLSLKIFNGHILLDEVKLNFLFYMKYSKIISQKEFSSIYKISYISKNYNFTSFSKTKNEKHILLFDSNSTFITKRTNNISNIIIFPEKNSQDLNKKLLIYFDLKQYIFFVEQEQYNNILNILTQYEDLYVRIFVPEEISKNFLKNNNEIKLIPEYYFPLMFFSFILFFFYLFHYNFIIPLLYKEYWLFFISQFYLFIPLRFIILILLSIKLIIMQNTRGLISTGPGFFVILAIQKSLIKTNIITIVLLSNEGLYIFENMTSIIRRMNIYQLQFLFLSVFLILLLSFPFHLIIIFLDFIISPFIIIHAIFNYRKLRRTLKIAYLIKIRYVPYIKLKISIWIKQNVLLSIYFISLIIIYFYSRFSTNNMLIDEIICLKNDMLEYCVENIFLFAFCYLYRPRNLERNFFIVYTERLDFVHLKFFITNLKKEEYIRNKCLKASKSGNYISRRKIESIRKEHFNKPIIILNPRYLLKNEIIQKNKVNNNKILMENEYNFSIGNIN